MAAKRHHASHKKSHHKMRHHEQSEHSRYKEHAGEERRLHGYHRGEAKHHSSSKENHGGSMDPEHYSEHRRGTEGYHSFRDGRAYDVGTDPRKTEAMQDGGMIREDMRAIANLPQEVMMKPYPMTGPYLPEGLDDTIAGVDRQMDYDDSKRRMNFYPKKV